MKRLFTETQIEENRKGIEKMWKKIPKSWVNLNLVLRDNSKGYGNAYDTERIAKACDGPKGPKRVCSAVGCFFGWNLTYYPYRQWCSTNNIEIDNTNHMDVFLGLSHDHDLYDSRENFDIPERDEVDKRIAVMLNKRVYNRYTIEDLMPVESLS